MEPLSIIFLPFIIVGAALVVKNGAIKTPEHYKRAEFCTQYTMKDGGAELKECYDVYKKQTK